MRARNSSLFVALAALLQTLAACSSPAETPAQSLGGGAGSAFHPADAGGNAPDSGGGAGSSGSVGAGGKAGAGAGPAKDAGPEGSVADSGADAGGEAQTADASDASPDGAPDGSACACGPLEQCSPGQFCTPKLVSLPAGYSIDATEVTRAQYEAWLDTSPALNGQPPWCASWNTDYTPSCEWPPTAHRNEPVVCVDWCDAYAYCKGVGKRLCGSRDGGPNDYDAFADGSKSQWFHACSSNSANEYPYGASYDGTACNGKGKGAAWMIECGSLASCQSPLADFAGVFDLSGNVWEWEDSCNGATGKDDWCRLRGGSFVSDSAYLRCASANSSPRYSGVGHFVGIRCCSP
ncbi:MAG: SUMF1/EgtB/PvdO family nonheme iron enzyme [Deltaproteobacteria bacterium]|nr:SUMF1/EgtB/PvdO family nonheme iron enzyme [Deltaproteobacteria bacterium]